MERQVILRDRQEQQAADHTNIQTFVAESLDDIVYDAIHDGRAYAGFDTAASGTTQVTSQPGQLYNAGAVHVARDAVVLNLYQYLPAATKKKVALVTWATESDLDVQPRDFLINVDTGETEPQSVAMEHRRVANVAPVPGVESPDPQPPTVGSTQLVFCYVTLTTTGIESVEMVAANRLPRLKDIAQSLNGVVAWREQTEPRLTTIGSDITKLNQQLTGLASTRDMFRLFADVARLKELAELPDDYADYGADRYLTTDETDVTNVNLLAKVEEGIRFSDANAGLAELNVFSTLNANQVIANGILLPKYNNITRLNITGYAGEVSISQYGYQTFDVIQRMMSATRIRYGSSYTYCTNSAWWKAGTYDPVTKIFTREGQTFQVVDGDPLHDHQMLRVLQFWKDTYDEPYWDYVIIDHSITGAQVAQTFLNTQDGWLTQIGFYLTRRAGSGNVNLTVCETTNGAPNLSKAIMQMTVPYADLKLYPQQTLVTIPPTYLKAGSRYAIVITTNADHWLALASGNAYAQGTFFYSTDGAFYQGDLTKDAMLTLNFAAFTAARVVIDMQPLQLDGGICNIDINADMIAPAATQLVFEVQVASNWIALSEVNTQALIGLPPLIPLRCVFVGTTDIMPGVKLVGSAVKVARPRTSFKHISSPRLLAANTSSVKLQLRLEHWNAAHHTITPKLLVGAGYATEETADVTETTVVDDYAVLKTYTFNLAAPRNAFKIQIEGGTTSALDTFHVAERVDVEA